MFENNFYYPEEYNYKNYYDLQDEGDLDYLKEAGSIYENGQQTPYTPMQYTYGRQYTPGSSLASLYRPEKTKFTGANAGYSWQESPEAMLTRLRKQQQQSSRGFGSMLPGPFGSLIRAMSGRRTDEDISAGFVPITERRNPYLDGY